MGKRTNSKSSKPAEGKVDDKKSDGGRQTSFKQPYNKQGKQRQLDTQAPYRKQYTKDNSTKQQRRGFEAADTVIKESDSNPVEFYTKFADYAIDAAKLPFARPLGSVFAPDYTQSDNDPYTVPGVMAIEFYPAVGVSKDFTSPINRSSIRFYTYLRSNQKASALYDHQDITMMEVALDSGYMFHALLTRAYKLLRAFSPVNEYYPKALLTAMGMDFDDLKQHIQDLRAYINNFAYNLGQYVMPRGITLFDRHRWMCEGLYVDSDTTRAQTYMFVPRGFYVYDNTVESGSQCVYNEFLYNTSNVRVIRTFAQLVAFGDSIINAISNEEDFAVISGDIYNFYGGDVYTLPYLTENELIVPTFDKTVLSQIENLCVAGTLSNLNITQNPTINAGAILFQPSTSALSLHYSSTNPMNFHWDHPTPEDVIEASRLTFAASVEGTGIDSKLVFQSCGTEIVSALTVFFLDPEDMQFKYNGVNTAYQLYGNSQPQAIVRFAQDVAQIAQFDWAPRIDIWYADELTTGEEPSRWLGCTWDIDVYDTVRDEYLEQIHRACLMSLFEVGNNRSDQ